MYPSRYIVSMPHFYALVQDKDTKSHENWKAIHVRVVGVCDRIWEEVKPILCIDSPEGHTDEPIEELGVGPKDILSYSWRGLRESRYRESSFYNSNAILTLVACFSMLP